MTRSFSARVTFTPDQGATGWNAPPTAGWLLSALDEASIRVYGKPAVMMGEGGTIPFAETHVMEHGLYVLEGKAVYRLNDDWVEVEAGDFMWLRAFCPQACYAGGPGRFRYLLYKDVNRHPRLKLFGSR